MSINLREIHSECGWHEKAIKSSQVCGCFSCLAIFLPSEIKKWIEEPSNCPRGAGKTAMCPVCDIDTVLPDSIEGGLSIQLLELMQKEYLS